jgi:DNA-directed RNA polymerase subunit RPC12/RpoP
MPVDELSRLECLECGYRSSDLTLLDCPRCGDRLMEMATLTKPFGAE